MVWIRCDRRAVRRLRTVEVLPLVRQQEAEAVVRLGVPRISRDRRTVRRLRAVDVLPLDLQQVAEVVLSEGVTRRIRREIDVGASSRPLVYHRSSIVTPA